MMRVVALLFAIVGTASAGTEEIRELIQSKLKLNLEGGDAQEVSLNAEAIDCSQGQSLFCPVANPPDVVFPQAGGILTALSSPCCPRNYLQCQVQQSQQYCRNLGFYTIPQDSGNSEQVCPPTNQECTCQQSLSVEPALRLLFCPQTEPCCSNCECYGDPHCRSFSGAQRLFATCDGRDNSCNSNAETCTQRTYNGQTCKWVPAKNGQLPYCAIPDNTAIPNMIMYRKNYKKYFSPQDNNVYEFKLVLTLGPYGAITKIELTDSGTSAQTYSWFLDASGNCKGNSAYPFQKGIATVGDLQSMVTMEFVCKAGNNRAAYAGRLDVLNLQDPWFISSGTGTDFGGFCATGIIVEATADSQQSECNTVDRQIVQYFGCKGNVNIDKCKQDWCNDNYYKLDYSKFVPAGTPVTTIAQKRKQCTNFVTNKAAAQQKNFMAAVCASSKAVSHENFPVDPSTCESVHECQACINNLVDYPEEIRLTLNGEQATTVAPNKPCPDLLSIGLARKQLGLAQSGVQIDFQAINTQTWTPVFALFNDEIDQCGCSPIFANGSVLSNRPLFTPGKYRIKQCNGLDTDPDQEMCTTAPGYNTTVIYTNPASGEAFSEPYGALIAQKSLVCNPSKYKGCPNGYQCCVWENSNVGWTDCMIGAYGPTFAKNYPNCKFPGT